MADINCVTLTGRLTREAELKYAASGNAIVRFSLAVNRAKRNPDGSWGEEPSYFDCVYFGKPAEALNSFLSRGRQVTVLGELRQSRWEQDGQTRSRVEVFVNNLTLGSASRGGDQNGAPMGDGGYSQPQRQSYNQNSYAKPQAPSYQQQPVQGPEGFQDDDIPF